ncbi:hypothetical protein SODALDRAFT_377455 [Sodiomyces alkalinus F11]|uniref:Uncharacterized protein n=1 Tax=Sodiomyces alkalinus (strain CBS 110278 / VKM F-3762 / F11) TaxID=1314773 RepID=A0A3N2PY79_SODAK|nr:hypothetical protein SODALDRAFT_377455 [Sodiomyces alkalinus F11]ROT39499.1 hypothetical protein SODALDRAFT_377455 [Sodiomyces alkalinus F11]
MSGLTAQRPPTPLFPPLTPLSPSPTWTDPYTQGHDGVPLAWPWTAMQIMGIGHNYLLPCNLALRSIRMQIPFHATQTAPLTLLPASTETLISCVDMKNASAVSPTASPPLTLGAAVAVAMLISVWCNGVGDCGRQQGSSFLVAVKFHNFLLTRPFPPDPLSIYFIPSDAALMATSSKDTGSPTGANEAPWNRQPNPASRPRRRSSTAAVSQDLPEEVGSALSMTESSLSYFGDESDTEREKGDTTLSWALEAYLKCPEPHEQRALGLFSLGETDAISTANEIILEHPRVPRRVMTAPATGHDARSQPGGGVGPDGSPGAAGHGECTTDLAFLHFLATDRPNERLAYHRERCGTVNPEDHACASASNVSASSSSQESMGLAPDSSFDMDEADLPINGSLAQL